MKSSSSKDGNNRRQQRSQASSEPSSSHAEVTTNITIIQVSSPLHHRKERKDLLEVSVEEDDNYKSNVQIIPSNFNLTNSTVDAKVTTVQVSSGTPTAAYGKILKKNNAVKPITIAAIVPESDESMSAEPTTNAVRSFGPITNIPINADKPAVSTTQLHYEQVFVTPPATSSPKIGDGPNGPSSPKFNFGNKAKKAASHSEVHINRINLSKSESEAVVVTSNGGNVSAATSVTVSVASTSGQSRSVGTRPFNRTNTNADIQRPNVPAPVDAPSNRPLLTRGVTEAVIQRPSRKDVNLITRGRSKPQPAVASDAPNITLRNEVFEQRQRSSSTSDAQGLRNRSNNNNNGNSNNNNLSSGGNQTNGKFQANLSALKEKINPRNGYFCFAESRRIQMASRPANDNASVNPLSRLPLREQQVLQLRREMMHPGGVRLQLRRKDCIGSIAFVDAFGGVW